MTSLLSQLGAMGGPQGPPPGGPNLSALPDPDEPQGGGGAPDGGLAALQDMLNDFPPLLAALTNADDVHDGVQAFKLLTGIQKRLMGGQGASASSGR